MKTISLAVLCVALAGAAFAQTSTPSSPPTIKPSCKAQASDNFELLMKRFGRGEFDLVGVGRSLLQDPKWAYKARVGQAFEPFSNESLSVLT